jgi:hypothetical protein
LIEIKKENQKKEEDIILLWISTDHEDFSIIYNLIDDDGSGIHPIVCITNDSLQNFPSLIKEFFGYEFII